MSAAQQPGTGYPGLHAHASAAADVAAGLQSGEPGLSSDEAARRLQHYGPNRLPPAQPRPWWKRLLAQVHNVLIYILIGSAALVLALGHALDAAVILLVVAINVLVGFVQEGRAEAVLRGILGMVSTRATVLRDGVNHTIDAVGLVPGDRVRLEAGDRVPADLRLLVVHNLRVDESMLTGESQPVSKDTASVAEHAPLAERRGMAYLGTLVTAGYAQGVVVATGSRTELGAIGDLVRQAKPPQTPLTVQLDRFGRGLAVVIVIVALLAMAWGVWVTGMPLGDMFLAAVGISVAAIPEGLPAIVTITLAIGVRRMAAVKALIRRLPAVEVLGSVTVICSDKTGTLTCNEMTARRIVTAAGMRPVQGEGYAPQGRIGDGPDDAVLALAARIALQCNDARVQQDDGGHWQLHGDPTEGALHVLALKAGLSPPALEAQSPRRALIPFASESRYMASLHGDADQALLLVKGAPERLLAFSTAQQGVQGPEPLDAAYWQQAVAALAADGLRVMALGWRPLPAATRTLPADAAEHDLVLVALVGLVDPPRPEAIQAVADCQRAGIRVCMITGDNPLTAGAIAGQIGIPAARVVTGDELDGLSPQALAALAQDVSVFARTSPTHKIRLVEALQADGEVVAMTGDGVNDAPALRRADIGVAMGLKGTDAAREAAAMVLVDDNFATIADAVRAGRTVYDNIRKTIIYILPTSLAEAGVILLAVLVGHVLPITPVQVLWVNMITAVTLSLVLAFEGAEPGVMQRPPRPPEQGLVSGFLLWRLLLVGGMGTAVIFWQFSHYIAAGAAIEHARTLAVNTLVMIEMWYLFSARCLYQGLWQRSAWHGAGRAWLGAACVLAVQWLFTHTAPFQRLFDTVALGLGDWLLAALWALPVLLVVELEKAFTLRRQQR